MLARVSPRAIQSTLLLGCLLLALYAYPLAVAGWIPLLDPDEGIHASISQEMARDGDWICPRFIGEPFRDKPILFFWAQAASLALFGMNEAAVRLPGLVFALLGVFTTGLVARRLFGTSAGWLAVMLQATMILPVALAQSPVHDLALVPLTNLALLWFWDADREPGGRGWRAVALAGAMLGLAALTKGLLGAALVACPAFAYLILSRRMRVSICIRAIAALAIGTLVAAPWYIAMSLRTPGYAHYFFVERHLHGFLTDTQMHGDAPWWYYLPMLLGGGLPWIAYLPIAAWQLWNERRRLNSDANGARLFAWCWLVVSAAFLSSSHSKLVTYILPTFPAIALLASDLWARCRAGELRPNVENWLWRSFAFSSAGGVLVLPIAMHLAGRQFNVSFGLATWLLCVVVSCCSLLPLWRFSAHSVSWRLGAGAAAMACCFVFAMTCLMPRVAPAKSAQDLASHFNRAGRLPQRLLIAEERIGSFVFYLDADLREQLTAERIAAVRIREFAKFPEQSPDTLLSIPERSMRRGAHYLGLGEVPYVRAGRYRVFETRDALPLGPRVVRTP